MLPLPRTFRCSAIAAMLAGCMTDRSPRLPACLLTYRLVEESTTACQHCVTTLFHVVLLSCQHRHGAAVPNNDRCRPRVHQQLLSYHSYTVQSNPLVLALHCTVPVSVASIVGVHVAVCFVLLSVVSCTLQDEEGLLQCHQVAAQQVVADAQLQLTLINQHTTPQRSGR